MKKARISCLIVALMLIMVIFAGCNKSVEDQSDQTTAKENTTTNANAASETSQDKQNFNKTGYPIVNEKITVTSVYSPYPGWQANDPQNLSVFRKLEEVTNIHVEWTLLPADQDSAVQLFLAAGDFPDFFRRYIGPEEQFKYGVEGGLLVDYSSMMEEYMPNMISWFTEFPEAKNIITHSNGAVYTLPRIQKASTSAAGQMFFRTDYLEKVNMDVPKTIEEFYDVLTAIKNANLTDGYAVLQVYNSDDYIWQTENFLFAAFGDSVDTGFADDGTGKVVFNRVSDQFRCYLEFANKLFREGLLENELFTIDPETSMSRVKLGQAAFMSSAYNLDENDFEDGMIHLDCLAPLTSEYTDIQKVLAYPYVYSVGGAISVECEYVEELLRMFDISFAREEVVPGSGLYGLSESTGLEGVDWRFTNPEKTAMVIMTPNGYTESVWKWIGNNVTWGEDYGAVVTMATTGTANTLARELGMINNNIPYAVTGFPDSDLKYDEQEKTLIANKMTDILSYADQMRARFITGVEPLSNWEEYVKTIKDMGVDDVLEQKQKAYDRWLAAD